MRFLIVALCLFAFVNAQCTTNLFTNGDFSGSLSSQQSIYMGGTGNVRIDSTLIPTNPVLVVNNSGSYFRQTLNFAAGQYSFMTFSLAIANELHDLTNVGDTNSAVVFFRNATGYQVGALVFPFAAPSAATRQWQVYTVSGAVPPTATYLQLDINKAVYDVANPKNVFYVDNLVAIGTCTGSPMNATKPGTLPYNLDCAANPGPSCPPLCDACTNNIIQNGGLTDGVTSNFMVWPQGSTDVRIDNTLVPGNSILVVNGTGSYFRVTQSFNAGQYTTMTFSLSVANELNDCSNAQDTASAVIYFRDATNYQVGGLVFPFQAQTIASSRYWKVYTVSGPVPATATYFQLDINKAVYNLANPKNTFYVDNLVAIGNCASTTVNSTNPATLPYNLDCTTIAGPSCPVVCDACQTNLIQNGAFTNGATSNFLFYPQGTTDVRIDNTLISGNPVLVVNGTGSYFRATLNFSPGQYSTMSFSLSIANELNDCSNVQDTNSAVVYFRNATGFQVGGFVFPFAAPSIATREWQVYTVAGPVPATATYFQLDINKAVYNLANPKNKFYIDNLIAVGNCASTTLNATKPTGLPYNLNCGAQPGNSCPDMCSVTPPPTPPTPAPTPVPTTAGPTTAGPTTAAPTPSQNGSGGNIITDSANVNMVSKMLIFVCAVFVVFLFA